MLKRISPSQYGICRIVPPKEWKPPFNLASGDLHFQTRLQQIHRLQQARGFDMGKDYSLEEYKVMADAFEREFFKDSGTDGDGGSGKPLTAAEKEAAYWHLVEKSPLELEVEYGNDIDTQTHKSGFLDGAYNPNNDKTGAAPSSLCYERCKGWNLNLLPTLPGSVLRHFGESVNGVTIPWVYVGMLFSSFCWHNEDDYLYSINYNHTGAPKQWYGIAGKDAEKFETTFRQSVPRLFDEEPDLLFKLVTQLSPALLLANRVPVCKTLQEAGQFVITFPKAYHAGFNHGYNCAEAVNFALEDWFVHGRAAGVRYRKFARASVFSLEKLLLTCAVVDPASHARDVLGKELAHLRDKEAKQRTALENAGVVHFERVGSHSTHHIAQDDVPDLCDVCKHHCFLSYVHCKSHPDRVMCLSHFKQVCDCHITDIGCRYRLSVQELDQLVQRFS